MSNMSLYAQLGLDENYDNEGLERLILNYHEKNVKKFTIHCNSCYDRKKHKYEFINDSTFVMNKIYYYHINGSEIDYIQDSLDIIAQNNYNSTYKWILRDSLDWKINSLYNLKENGDSILQLINVFKIDSIENIRTLLIYNFSENRFPQKIYTKKINSDSTIEHHFKFINNEWKLFKTFQVTKKEREVFNMNSFFTTKTIRFYNLENGNFETERIETEKRIEKKNARGILFESVFTREVTPNQSENENYILKATKIRFH
jgi:hypothetical protein